MYKVGYDYVIKNGDAGVVIATAITILQIKAGAAALELLKVVLGQGLSETSTQEQVQILRKTAAATVTSFTPRKLNAGDASALCVGGTAATGYTATAEGTDGEVLVDEAFNVLAPWIWVPAKERIIVPQGGILAIKFPVAPASQTWRCAAYVREYQ